MGVSECTDVFPYVTLNWCQHQEGACKYKLKNIKYTCIEWFFCHFSQAYIMQWRKWLIFHLSIIFIRNIFIWSLEVLCSIPRITNREGKENRKSLFFILRTLYRLLYLQWYNSKHSTWTLTLHFLQYIEIPLHPGKLHCRCEPLLIQRLIQSNFKLFASWCKLWLPVNIVVGGNLFLYRL